MMLLGLTLERYFAICHPEKKRPIFNTNYSLLLIILGSIIVYLPSIFKSTITICQENVYKKEFYFRHENSKFISSSIFMVCYFLILPSQPRFE